jgi:hypothetical protein
MPRLGSEWSGSALNKFIELARHGKAAAGRGVAPLYANLGRDG